MISGKKHRSTIGKGWSEVKERAWGLRVISCGFGARHAFDSVKLLKFRKLKR
jgi:hypothetical protein